MPVDPLAGTTWSLADGIELPPGVVVTAELRDGMISGSSGCNTYRAPYELDGERFRLSGPAASTLMMCPEPQMAVEAEVLRRLERVAAFRLDGDRLELRDGEGNILLGLRRAGASDLLGTWRIISVHVPERQAIVSVDGELDLTFEGEMLRGSAGCNRFSGPWSAEDAVLRVGPLATTRKICPEPVMAQERALLRALDAVVAWRVTRAGIHLLRDDGGIAVSLARPT